jgi:hypothetical protein
MARPKPLTPLTPEEARDLLHHNRNIARRLTHAKAFRGGVQTRGNKRRSIGSEVIRAYGDKKGKAIEFDFTITAGGQGATSLTLTVGSADFPAVLAFMSYADRNAALKAMAEELRYQICGPMR